MWKGSKDKREKLEDEMDWNKLARFYVVSILAAKLTSYFVQNNSILASQAAAAILGHHEGTVGSVGNHLEYK